MTLGVLMRVMSGAEAGSEDPCGPGEGRGQPGRGGERAGRRHGREFWGPGGPSIVDDKRSGRQVPSGCGQGGSLRPHDFGDSRVSS